MVERRIRGLRMTVDFMYLSAEVTLTSALDSASRRGILYAVVVTHQHEVHQSITLNILYGTPQGTSFANSCSYRCTNFYLIFYIFQSLSSH